MWHHVVSLCMCRSYQGRAHNSVESSLIVKETLCNSYESIIKLSKCSESDMVAQQEALSLDPPGVELAGSPRVCVASLQVLQLTLAVQQT